MNNHSVQNLNKEEPRYCLNCNKLLPDDKYHLKMKNQVCNNQCRKELTAKTIEEERRTAQAILSRSRKHNRKCQVCGKPCYPNYFFCSAHFHQATGDIFDP
jgi:predicted nucleic acid-binding Zn ribbon protein